MGVLEVIAPFYLFLEVHIGRYENKGKSHPLHLSEIICDVFIEHMTKAVKDCVLDKGNGQNTAL